MSYSGWSANNYLFRSDAPIAAMPLAIVVRAKRPAVANAALAELCTSGTNLNKRSLRQVSTNLAAFSADGSSSNSGAIANSTTDAYFLAGGLWLAGNDRRINVNGSAGTTGTTSLTTGTPNKFIVGAGEGTSGGIILPWNGEIAEVGLYDATGWSGTDNGRATFLADALTDLHTNDKSLLHFTDGKVSIYPLNGDFLDYSGSGNHLTLAGTLTATTHPTLSYPLLGTPTFLTGTAISSRRIRLDWSDGSITETGFTVQRSPNGTDDWVTIGTAEPGSPDGSATFTATGLAAETEYFFRVRAVNAIQVSDWSDVASATTAAADRTRNVTTLLGVG
jgi:hypothetical protein